MTAAAPDHIAGSSDGGRSRADAQAAETGGRTGVVIALLLVTTYVVFMFVRPPAFVGPTAERIIYAPKKWFMTALTDAGTAIGVARDNTMLFSGAYLVACAMVIPWVAMIVMRRGRPFDLGIRRPNRLAWRLIALCLVASMPALIWMAASPGIAEDYLPQLRRNFAGFAAFYLVNMLSEHFLFHGVMLAAFRRGHRWPPPVGIVESAKGGFRRVLQWFGLAQPTDGATGLRRALRWIGLPDGCLLAVIASGVLFAVVHMGKDTRELILSLPGGIALGFVAYRTNSCVVPFAIHLATAGAAVVMMAAFGQG